MPSQCRSRRRALYAADGNRARVRRAVVGRLRFRLVVRQAQVAQVRRRSRAKGRAEADPRPVAKTEPWQRGRGRGGQRGKRFCQSFFENPPDEIPFSSARLPAIHFRFPLLWGVLLGFCKRLQLTARNGRQDTNDRPFSRA